MDYEYIVDHAIKNVWQSPRQDRQIIIEPARLTNDHGAYKKTALMWQTIPTPDETHRWHIYQIGGTHPIVFNLFAKCYEWVALPAVCEQKEILVDVYVARGYKLPLANVYYRFTADHNLIIAAKIDATLPINLNKEKLYLRLYSNAYFDSTRSSAFTDTIKVYHRQINSTTDRNVLKVAYDLYKARTGHTWLIINGLMYEDWDESLMPIGAYVELFYDVSVKKVLRIRFGSMATFSSTLDDKLKYLVHYAGKDDETIDYQDDIDVYIAMDYKGYRPALWYNKNNPDAMRQLTHRDYSLVTTYVKRYAEIFQGLPGAPATVEPRDLYAYLFIRHSGYNRPLTYTHSRIHELYKMSDLNVRRAMTGIDATVPVWRAENLENAGYPLLMRRECCEIDNDIVEAAYGYNAISKYLADTPIKPTNVNGVMSVPVGYKLQFGSTAYEYNTDGLMTGWYHHYVGDRYNVRQADTAYVEMIAGFGGKQLEEHWGVKHMTISEHQSYRVYECMAIGGVPDLNWKDITGSPVYNKTLTEFEYIGSSMTSYIMLRSDRRFLARDYELSVSDGVLSFILQQEISTPNGLKDATMTIPLGQIDVILNGHSLIKDLDYFVEFPRVFIVNRKYLKRPIATEKQRIHVRFTGFCSKDFEIVPEGNRGFIEHGFLSNDSRFNLRDDKVLRIIVDGKLRTRDELLFSEIEQGNHPVHALNGLPYLVKDILVSVSGNIISDMYVLRDESMVIDKQVSDYLTKRIPQPERSVVSSIFEKYQLYSPFTNKLIMDLILGHLILPSKPDGFTRQDVLEICQPYEWLLSFDPSQVIRQQDERYVLIHPHGEDVVLDLKKSQYQFIQQVINNYMPGNVVLSGTVRLVAD